MTVAVTDALLEWGDGSVRFESHPDPGAWARFVLTDLTGWYGGVGVRSERMDRLGHGMIAGRTWRQGRAMTLQGHVDVRNPDDRDGVMRDLSGVLWDGLEGTITGTVDGLTLSCEVRIDGEVGIVPQGIASIVVQVPLHAADPWLYSEWRTTSLRPVGAGVGLVYPVFAPSGVMSYGTAADTDEVVWNDGNAESHPRFTVHANAPGGFLVGLGDRVVEYPRPTWDTTPVIVDMTGEVLVGGFDQSQYLSSREWSSIPPHSLETPRFELLQGGTGWCEVSHRDTNV